MGETIIPLADLRVRATVPALPPDAAPASGGVADALGRPLGDLRISVTDRCNFRCGYCMPKSVFDRDYVFLPQPSLLSFEEIGRLARAFVAGGTRKIRLTGGEPLLRKGIEHLVALLKSIATPDGGRPELTLTTNGVLLAKKARALRDAGLDRVTVSLDALDDATFRRMNDMDVGVAPVLDGLAAAADAGFGRGAIKVNMVVQRGVNDAQIEPMARHFRDAGGRGATLRFIEFMDVGATNGWKMDQVLPSADVLHRLRAIAPLAPLDAAAPGETAERWAWADGRGEIGLISSVTRPFCGDCNRARLSTEGKLFLCLFASSGFDLRALLRAAEPASDAQLAAVVRSIWSARADRYSELRSAAPPEPAASPAAAPRRVEMSYIGG